MHAQTFTDVDAGVAALACFADYDMRKQEAQLSLQVNALCNV